MSAAAGIVVELSCIAIIIVLASLARGRRAIPPSPERRWFLARKQETMSPPELFLIALTIGGILGAILRRCGCKDEPVTSQLMCREHFYLKGCNPCPKCGHSWVFVGEAGNEVISRTNDLQGSPQAEKTAVEQGRAG